MEERRVDKVFRRKNGEYVLVTNLVVHVCQHCGQESVPHDTARLIEDVLYGRIPATTVVSTELYDSAAIETL